MKPSILFALLLSCMSAQLFAFQAKPDPAKWSLETGTVTFAAGDTAIVKLKVHMQDGWHTYGLKDYLNADGVGPQKTEITSDSKELALITKRIKSSKPLFMYDSAFEVNVEKFKHDAEFKLPLSCSRAMKPGTYNINIVVYYQACTAQNCLSPKEVKLPLTVLVKPAAGSGNKSEISPLPATGAPSGPTGSSNGSPNLTNAGSADGASTQVPTAATNQGSSGSTAQESKNATSSEKPAVQSTASTKNSQAAGQEVPQSLLALILLAMGFGASSWVMPCVYPMIPITVSFFTKRSDKEKTHPITDSLVYSLGIMSTYIVFGALAAIFFGATAGRDFASLPWVNFFLALLFVIIAGNLFGMYEIALPASLVNSLNKKSTTSKGYSASFIMGMVFSLTAFTCTVPFIDLVGKISSKGDWFYPIIGMSFYAAVFALPFFLLALFPSVLTKLPRSGAWMNNIKVVFGFVELAFAVSYFARSDSLSGWGIISREVVLSIWAGCSFMIMLYILGVFRMKLDSHVDHVGGFRATLALVFATLTFYVFDGIKSDSVGPLEPFVYVESSHTSTASVTRTSAAGSTAETSGASNSAGQKVTGVWMEDLNEGLSVAKKIGKPVFVDFTGISCTNCRWMEKNMFTKPEVRSLMDGMILVRAFTDRRHIPQDKVYQQMEEQRFGSTLLPLYVLLSPNDDFIASSTYTPETSQFVEFLQKAGKGSTSTIESTDRN